MRKILLTGLLSIVVFNPFVAVTDGSLNVRQAPPSAECELHMMFTRACGAQFHASDDGEGPGVAHVDVRRCRGCGSPPVGGKPKTEN